MRDGRWQGIQEAFGEKALPLGMPEGNDVNAVTEAGELGSELDTFRVFGQRQEVDAMIDAEALQQVIRAMVSAAIERPGNIGIEGKYSH